jgi:ATP-binding cassette subfamily C protein CydCD
MYFNKKLWSLTTKVRRNITASVAMGLVGSMLGIGRLLLLGMLIAKVIGGASLSDSFPLILATLTALLMYSLWEYQRLMLAHRTAATVQHQLRISLFDQMVKLGPSFFSQQRSGEMSNAAIEGVEQLEIYFGRYLPQLFVAAITPLLIFVVVAQIDLPVATVLLVAALFTLLAPSIFQRLDSEKSMHRARAYKAFASEFLDALQGLVTLKAFGQAKARESALSEKAHHLFQSTMWVMATNSLARGITDIGITLGAAGALALSAYRVEAGLMSFESLLLVLLLGVEVFKPLRELRSLMHAGMLAQAAAGQVFSVLESKTQVIDSATNYQAIARDDQSISFENVSFSYHSKSTDDAPKLSALVHDQLNFSINSGQRIGVVGSSGGGKTTIVNLLLRYYDPQAGVIRIGGVDIQKMPLEQLRSQFSVVSQDNYIFHGSIRDNLTLGCASVSDEALITAAKAANADEFIRQLDRGYDSVIGERGVRLSGGQQQRLSIARALLRDAPILILDEALSSVDAKNEAQIQQALNTLMQGRTCLILAHRLSSIIDCDQIMLLDKGRVAEMGNHDELLAANGQYTQLMSAQHHSQQSLSQQSISQQHFSDSGTELDEQGSINSDAGSIAQASTTAVDQSSILQGDKHSWGQVLRMLLSYAASWKGRLILTFLLGVGRVFSYIGVSVFSALAAFAVKSGEASGTWLGLLITCAVLAAFLHWFESWLAHDMAFRMLAQMRIKLFSQLERLAPAFMVRHRSGDLINLATHDVEMVEYFFAHTITPVFVAVLVPSAVLVLLASFSWTLAAALLPFILLVFLMPVLFRKNLDKAAGKARVVLATLSAHTVESLQGLAQILNYQASDERKASFESLIEQHKTHRSGFFSISALQSVSVEFITLCAALVMLVIATPLANAGVFDAGYLPLIALASVAAFLPVIEVADVGRQLSETLAATSRLMQVEEAEPAVLDNGQTTPSINSKTAMSVVFKDITFSYSSDTPQVLSKVDLVIEAGSKVALVGASGAGKSTLAHLLMRFWDPQQGDISIDGINIKEMPLEHFRNYVAIVAQDTYLFNASISDNLLMAKPEATRAQLLEAIEMAQLTDFVSRQNEGLDTLIGERGYALSGGQRQRLSIARAFLRDAPILILDEATSHLDSISEAAVHKALQQLMQHRTTLVIAHRLASVEDADKIVLMDGGTVIEQGNHQQLLAQNGRYAQLVKYQRTRRAA